MSVCVRTHFPSHAPPHRAELVEQIFNVEKLLKAAGRAAAGVPLSHSEFASTDPDDELDVATMGFPQW